MTWTYFVLLLTLTSLAKSKCPPPEVVSPCFCEAILDPEIGAGRVITCNGSAPLDLKSTLDRVSANRTADEKRFNELILSNSNITEIGPNATSDLTFASIEIAAENLKRIHYSAFQGTAEKVLYFNVRKRTKNLRSFGRPHNIFELINSFKNLYDLHFQAPGVSIIPQGAFKTLSKLHLLTFGARSANSSDKMIISNKAFWNLANLTHLDLHNTSLSFVLSNAFYFNKTKSPSKLNLHLNSCDLNSTSFAKESLKNFNRPVYLDLHSNRITFLNQTVFKPFVDNKNNSLTLLRNPIVCSDCRNAWLAKGKVKYEMNVLGAHCNGNTTKGAPNIFGSRFDNCTNSF